MTDLLDRTMGERIGVDTSLGASCPVTPTAPSSKSAILNVAFNARDAMPDGGTLTIRHRNMSDRAAGEPMSRCRSATPAAAWTWTPLGRAFEPFFTTKVTGKGTGLGLSQVYGFATQSGGDVWSTATPGRARP